MQKLWVHLADLGAQFGHEAVADVVQHDKRNRVPM